jgi:hypothetical protein
LHDAFPLLFGRLERLYSLESPSLPPAHNRSGDRFLLEETVSDVLTMACRAGAKRAGAIAGPSFFHCRKLSLMQTDATSTALKESA